MVQDDVPDHEEPPLASLELQQELSAFAAAGVGLVLLGKVLGVGLGLGPLEHGVEGGFDVDVGPGGVVGVGQALADDALSWSGT